MNSAQYASKLAKQAVDVPRKTLDDLATLYGLSVHTLMKYRLGYRSPDLENLSKLSEGLRLLARQLLLLREQIDKVIRDNG